MRLTEFLNEYEMDYAQSALRDEKLSFSSLKGAAFLVAGDVNPAFSKAILYDLLNLNDEKNLNVQTIYMPVFNSREERQGGAAETGDAAWNVTAEGGCNAASEEPEEFQMLAESRKDFRVGTMEDVPKADYVILTGLCNQPLPEEPLSFAGTIEAYERILQAAKRVIFLSDYRVFGKVRKDYLASEFEQADGNTLLLTLESLVAIYGKQYGYDYQIIRCGMAAGAGIEFDHNLLYRLADAVCGGEESEIIRSSSKYSFVYVNDIIRMIFYCLLKLEKNTVFHVAGRESTVTTGELVEYLYQNFPQQTRINLVYNREDPGYGTALNCEKAAIFGFEPKVSVEDALILLIKSRQTKPGEVFVFDGSYQGKLAQIHDLLLAYLLEIDRICKKHGIKYFLAGGTLLGAIRHHGFIPWDDDADVMMLRDDYEKFLKIIAQELPPNMKVQTPRTERGNHNVFTKIRIDNTLFATKFTGQFPAMHNGIFIDVVCHDQTANSRWGQRLHLLATLATRSMVFNKWGGTPIDTDGFPKLFVGMGNFAKKHLPMRFLEWLQERTIAFFARKRNAKYLYDGMGRNLRRGSFPKEWLGDAVYVDFEGCKLPVPREYDRYLTYLYGDYMQMIPVSERRMSHSIVWLDLGEYSGFRL
ncbi:MAG: LicD family protein [Lachnospiraceae bacterium]|nr:LicD family protein [Lachnospiraceae bacterium]